MDSLLMVKVDQKLYTSHLVDNDFKMQVFRNSDTLKPKSVKIGRIRCKRFVRKSTFGSSV